MMPLDNNIDQIKERALLLQAKQTTCRSHYVKFSAKIPGRKLSISCSFSLAAANTQWFSRQCWQVTLQCIKNCKIYLTEYNFHMIWDWEVGPIMQVFSFKTNFLSRIHIFVNYLYNFRMIYFYLSFIYIIFIFILFYIYCNVWKKCINAFRCKTYP